MVNLKKKTVIGLKTNSLTAVTKVQNFNCVSEPTEDVQTEKKSLIVA